MRSAVYRTRYVYSIGFSPFPISQANQMALIEWIYCFDGRSRSCSTQQSSIDSIIHSVIQALDLQFAFAHWISQRIFLCQLICLRIINIQALKRTIVFRHSDLTFIHRVRRLWRYQSRDNCLLLQERAGKCSVFCLFKYWKKIQISTKCSHHRKHRSFMRLPSVSWV